MEINSFEKIDLQKNDLHILRENMGLCWHRKGGCISKIWEPLFHRIKEFCLYVRKCVCSL